MRNSIQPITGWHRDQSLNASMRSNAGVRCKKNLACDWSDQSRRQNVWASLIRPVQMKFISHINEPLQSLDVSTIYYILLQVPVHYTWYGSMHKSELQKSFSLGEVLRAIRESFSLFLRFKIKFKNSKPSSNYKKQNMTEKNYNKF